MEEAPYSKENGDVARKKLKLESEKMIFLPPKFVFQNSSSYTYTTNQAEKIFFVSSMCNSKKLLTLGYCSGTPNVQLTVFNLKDFNKNGKLEPDLKELITVRSIEKLLHFDTRNTVILCSQAHCFRITLIEADNKLKLKATDSMEVQDVFGASFIGEAEKISIDGDLVAVTAGVWIYIYHCFPYLRLKNQLLRPGSNNNIKAMCLFEKAHYIALMDDNLTFYWMDVETESQHVTNFKSLKRFSSCDVMLCILKCNRNTEGISIIFSVGLIITTHIRTKIYLPQKLKCNKLNISSAQMCSSNKCIYLYDSLTDNIFIYSPIYNNILQKINGGGSNTLLKTELSINVFGDEIYFINSHNSSQLCVTQLYRGKNMSLEYLARTKLFKCFSTQQIKEHYTKLCLKYQTLSTET